MNCNFDIRQIQIVDNKFFVPATLHNRKGLLFKCITCPCGNGNFYFSEWVDVYLHTHPIDIPWDKERSIIMKYNSDTTLILNKYNVPEFDDACNLLLIIILAYYTQTLWLLNAIADIINRQ